MGMRCEKNEKINGKKAESLICREFMVTGVKFSFCHFFLLLDRN